MAAYTEAFSEDDGYVLKLSTDYETCNLLKSLYKNINSAAAVDINDAFSNVYPNPGKKEIYIRFKLKKMVSLNIHYIMF